MSIVPVRAKWKVKVKKIDGAERTVEIDQVYYLAMRSYAAMSFRTLQYENCTVQ